MKNGPNRMCFHPDDSVPALGSRRRRHEGRHFVRFHPRCNLAWTFVVGLRRAGGNGSRGRPRTHGPSPHSKRLPGARTTSSLVPLLVAERRHSPDFLLLLHPQLEPAMPLPCRPAGWDNVLDVDRAWSADGISMARGLSRGDGPEHSVIFRWSYR